MATQGNTLRLSVGLVFDSGKAVGDLKNQFKQVEKIRDNLAGKLNKGSADVVNGINTQNNAMKKQTGFIATLTNGWGKLAGKLVQFSLLSGGVLFFTTRVRDAVKLVIELDTAFTNFTIVTNATAEEIAKVDKRVTELSVSLGVLKKEAIDSVTEFSRAGFSISDSLILAEKAIMGANVGATDLASVTTFLIAGLKSFKLEAEGATQILDVLFKVANSTAINLEGIGDAFLRSANTLVFAGATLEQAAALIAASNETIQDPAKVGTALKTIASRLRGIGEEGEKIPTLARDFRAVGIEIQNADGSFRNIYDIFKEFAVVYKTLDDLTKESLLEKIAGKRQKNILIGLIDNFEVAEMALGEAMNSAGAVATANELAMESVAKKVVVFKNEVNKLYETLMSSDFLKSIIDLFTGLVIVLTKLVSILPNLNVLLGTGGLLFFASQLIPVMFTLNGAMVLTTASIFPLLGIFSALGLLLVGTGEYLGNTTDKTDELTEATNKLAEAQLKLKNNLIESSLEERKIVADNVDEIISELDRLRKFQEDEDARQSTGSGFSGALQSGKDAVTDYATEIDSLVNKLKIYGLTEAEARQFIRDTAFATEGLSDATLDLITVTEKANVLLRNSSHDYEILSDALLQLETDGYLADDMLSKLIETYPELASVTNLSKDAIIDFSKTKMTKTREDIANSLKSLDVEISATDTRIKLIQAEKAELADRAKVYAKSYGVSLADNALTTDLNTSSVALQNARIEVNKLKNELGQLGGIDKARKSAKDAFNKTSEKEVKLLSEQERAIDEINQKIDMNNKLLSRTDDKSDKIAINEELITLYKSLEVELQKQYNATNEQLAITSDETEAYDDLTNSLYKTALAIEDTRNATYSAIQANKDLTKSIVETDKAKAEENVKTATESITTAIKEQIKELENLKKANELSNQSTIDAKQAEIDLYNKQNDAIDDQIQLQEYLKLLQDARERKANILANRNVRLVQNEGVGFEFVSDPREIRKVNEEIVDAQTNLSKFQNDLSRKSINARLEAEKDLLEKTKEIEQEDFDRRIEEWETFQETINFAIENNASITKGLITSLMSSLGTIESASYSTRLSALGGFISDYNSKIATLSGLSGQLDALNRIITPAPQTVLGTGAFSSRKSNGLTPSTPSSSSLSSGLKGGGTNKTTYNNVSVKSNAPSIDKLLNDINSKGKVYNPQMQIR